MSSPHSAYEVIAGDLGAFTKFTYPGYQSTWHQDVIDEALRLVYTGKCKRLALSVPPQKGKTEKATVRFPTFCFANNPDKRIIINSYSADKAEDCSRQARDIVLTDRFKALFPHLELSKASQSVTHWQFEGYRGYIHAVGTGGPVTGFGADLLILDDPIKDREEADSEVAREKLWNWYTSVALTRLAPDAAVIVIHTRWNEDDLIGRLMERQKELWTYINIPAVDETTGRVVWPERWSRELYDQVRVEVGDRDWYALYQGQPFPPEGSLFKRKWFVVSPRAPQGLTWYRCWDIATTSNKSGSWTCGALIAVDDQKTLWIRDVIRGQWEWPEARRRIITTAQIDGEDITVLIEKGAYQFGKLAEDLVDNWEDIKIPVRAVSVKGLGDKEARARPWAARAEAGKVVLVGSHETPWIADFLDIVPTFRQDAPVTFPGVSVVDAVSLGFQVIASQPIGKSHAQNNPPPLSPAWAEQQRIYQNSTGNSGYIFGE